MTPRDLQSLILATPECAPHIHTGDMPKIGADEARAKDQAVADALMASGALKLLISRKVGEDDVLRECGLALGDAILTKLEAAANADSKIKRALRLLQKDDLDIGNVQTQAAINTLRGPLLTSAEADALLGMGFVAQHISAAQVSNALRGPWGDE